MLTEVRQYENTDQGMPPRDDKEDSVVSHMYRVAPLSRARELRWLYNQAVNENSDLYNKPDVNYELILMMENTFYGQPEE